MHYGAYLMTFLNQNQISFDEEKYKKMSLKEYVEAWEDPHIKSRPFDKHGGAMGANAQALSTTDFNLTAITLEYVIKKCELIDKVLQDLEELQYSLPKDIDELKSLRSGYVVNAYSRKLEAELNVDRVDELRVRSMIALTIIRDYLQNEKTPQEIYEKLKSDNLKNVRNVYCKCMREFLFEEKAPEEALSTADRIRFQLAAISETQLIHSLYVYADVCVDMLRPIKSEAVKNARLKHNVEQTRNALSDCWGRCMFKIEQEAKKPENASVAGAQINYIRHNNPVSDGFREIINFANDILSIQKRYESKWFGLKRMFNQDNEKLTLLNKIDSKLNDMIAKYPDVMADDIKLEMLHYLEKLKNSSVLRGVSVIKDQINRIERQYVDLLRSSDSQSKMLKKPLIQRLKDHAKKIMKPRI